MTLPGHRQYKLTELSWELIYEDCTDLSLKPPCVAAKANWTLYHKGSSTGANGSKLNWSHILTSMRGYTDAQSTELKRLYLSRHSDREDVNVSVGSAISDPYLSFAATTNGQPGPLRGLANQEVFVWLTQKEVGKEKL